MAEVGPLQAGVSSGNLSLDLFRQTESSLNALQNQIQNSYQSIPESQQTSFVAPSLTEPVNFDPNGYTLDISQQGFLLNGLIQTDPGATIDPATVLNSFQQASEDQVARNESIQVSTQAPSIQPQTDGLNLSLPQVSQPGIEAVAFENNNTLQGFTPSIPSFNSPAASSSTPQVDSAEPAPSPSVTYDSSGNTTPL